MSRLWIGASALLIAAACGDAGGEPPARVADPLLVMVAADLQAAIPELVALYERETGTAVDVVLGSTGLLTTQIEQGAPGDVFLAANKSFIDRLAARERIVPGTRRVYAIGPLAIVSAAGVPLPREVRDLAGHAYGTIAIANPEHAPYGAAAREALQREGIWDAVQPRLVFAENIAQALQFVRTGNADAAIVALGLVAQVGNAGYSPVGSDLHAPLRQTGAVLRGTRRPAEAGAFLDLITSEAGRRILAHYGFGPPDGT